MMLSLPNGIDSCVQGFVTMAMSVLGTQDVKPKTYKIHLMEMVINAIYYNPILTLRVLESNSWTNKFFSLWFGSMDSFSRVHDKKLCIVAIVSLLGINADQVPPSVSVGWPRLLQGITVLFRTLPGALKKREEALKDDFHFEPNSYDDYDDDDEWNEDEATWTGNNETEEEPADAKDESTAYIEFLNEEARKFSDADNFREEEDELGEDSVLLESPLDKIEPYQIFRASLMRMEQEQPQFYASLASHLSAEEKSIVQSVFAQAEAQIVMAQQLQQQQQQQQPQQQAVANQGPGVNGGAS